MELVFTILTFVAAVWALGLIKAFSAMARHDTDRSAESALEDNAPIQPH